MTLEKIAEINTHKELKEFIEYVISLTLSKQITAETAKSIHLLCTNLSKEIDIIKNNEPVWNT